VQAMVLVYIQPGTSLPILLMMVKRVVHLVEAFCKELHIPALGVD
jgi:hypothetical protein